MNSKLNEKEFGKFEDYVEHLNKYVYASNTITRLKLVLDGEPSRQYRNHLSIQLRRKNGAFFSSQHLANEIFKRANKYLNQNSRIIDPTCGIGSLLLPFAAQISMGANFYKTIDLITSKIIGYDNNPLLINTAKIRLLLLAKLVNRHLVPVQINPIRVFNNIKEQDFFNIDFNFKKSDIIVFNPPFGHVKSDEKINWGSGKIQIAALFTYRLLELTEPDQNIFAILPDVLRSGTRYLKWRNAITLNSNIVSVEPYGRFDKHTDVDVFILHLKKRKNKSVISNSWPVSSETAFPKTVGDYFDISIGSVVPHRAIEGNEKAYFINTKNTSRWGKLKYREATLIKGTKYVAPFIVVRRTSSPNDIYRAVPTLINEEGQFVIENHLLVLKPKCGAINKCKQLMKLLKDNRTNDWLNNYIRCRHLTKKSLLELPWWEQNA